MFYKLENELANPVFKEIFGSTTTLLLIINLQEICCLEIWAVCNYSHLLGKIFITWALSFTQHRVRRNVMWPNLNTGFVNMILSPWWLLTIFFFLSSKCSITQIETVMQCLSSEQKDLFLPLMKNKSRKIRGTNGFIVFIQWMVQF